MHRTLRVPSTLGLALLLLGATAHAEPVAAGQALEPFTLPDQHGTAHEVDAAVRVILFARDMDGGGFIRELLAESEGAVLERIGGVYVADVSGMPALIRRFIAVPRMRDRPYPMLLDEEGDVAARLPGEPGRATVVSLDALAVTGVQHFDSKEELAAALAELAGSGEADGAAPAEPPGGSDGEAPDDAQTSE